MKKLNYVKLLNDKMTAMDTILAIDELIELIDELVDKIEFSTGNCYDCHFCDVLELEPIKLPKGVLATAGIPENAKLNAFVDEETGIIHIEQAEYDFDLTDIPSDILQLLKQNKICLGELDALLVSEEII